MEALLNAMVLMPTTKRGFADLDAFAIEHSSVRRKRCARFGKIRVLAQGESQNPNFLAKSNVLT